MQSSSALIDGVLRDQGLLSKLWQFLRGEELCRLTLTHVEGGILVHAYREVRLQRGWRRSHPICDHEQWFAWAVDEPYWASSVLPVPSGWGHSLEGVPRLTGPPPSGTGGDPSVPEEVVLPSPSSSE